MAKQGAQSTLVDHPNIQQIERALVKRIPIPDIARNYMKQELKAGVKITALVMRLRRHAKTVVGKKIALAEKKAEESGAATLHGLLLDMHEETRGFRQLAAADKNWGAVSDLSANALGELELAAKMAGVGAPDPNAIPAHIQLQNIIALPHVGPVQAGEGQQDRGVIDVSA